MSKDMGRISNVLKYIKQHDGPQRIPVDRPWFAKVVNAYVFNASLPDMFHGLWHQIKAGHVESELVEFDQIASGSNSAFNQSSRWRTVFLKQLQDQLPLGNMPPVTVFQFNKFPEMAGVHECCLFTGFEIQNATSANQTIARGNILSEQGLSALITKPSTQKRDDAFWQHKR